MSHRKDVSNAGTKTYLRQFSKKIPPEGTGLPSLHKLNFPKKFCPQLKVTISSSQKLRRDEQSIKLRLQSCCGNYRRLVKLKEINVNSKKQEQSEL